MPRPSRYALTESNRGISIIFQEPARSLFQRVATDITWTDLQARTRIRVNRVNREPRGRRSQETGASESSHCKAEVGFPYGLDGGGPWRQHAPVCSTANLLPMCYPAKSRPATG